VLDALTSLQPDSPPRLVLLSPLSFEPPLGGTIADVTNRNAMVVAYAEAVWRMATNRNTEFVDLFGLSRSDVLAGLRAAETGKETPRLTEDGLHLTPYGSRRLVFALDRALRWPGNNWRFGLMSDGQWRSGGFGAQIHAQERRDDYAKIVFTEERLPTPNLVSALDPLQENKPQYYMQVRGLKSGQYDLRVDRKKNLSATHEDWERFRIISHGPSWDQAEELRQLIVKKNQLWQAWMEKQRQAVGAGKSIAPDPQIAELEAKIAQFKRPVQRTYELVRTGDAPAPTNAVSQLPAGVSKLDVAPPPAAK
jgi:hypothetical protein